MEDQSGDYVKETCTLHDINPDVRFIIIDYLFPQYLFQNERIINHVLSHTAFNNQDPYQGFNSNWDAFKQFIEEGEITTGQFLSLRNFRLLTLQNSGKVCLHRHVMCGIWTSLFGKILMQEFGNHCYILWDIFSQDPTLSKNECLRMCLEQIHRTKEMSESEEKDCLNILSQVFDKFVQKRVLLSKADLISDPLIKGEESNVPLHSQHIPLTIGDDVYAVNFDSLFAIHRNHVMVEYFRMEFGELMALICKFLLSLQLEIPSDKTTGIDLHSFIELFSKEYPNINPEAIRNSWKNLESKRLFGAQISTQNYLRSNYIWETIVKPKMVIDKVLKEEFGKDLVRIKNKIADVGILNLQQLISTLLLSRETITKHLQTLQTLGYCTVEIMDFPNPTGKFVEITIIRHVPSNQETAMINKLYKITSNLLKQRVKIKKQEPQNDNDERYYELKLDRIDNTIDLIGESLILLEYGSPEPYLQKEMLKKETKS